MYKIGQKVRVKDKFWELLNPTGLYTGREKRNLVGKVLEVGSIDSNGDIITKQGTIEDVDTHWTWHPSWLEPVEKTLDDLEVGDVVCRNGRERKVLAKIENVYALSSWNNFEDMGTWWALKEIKEFFTLKQPENTEKQKEDEAIEYLKSRGRIKKGEIVD